MIGLDGSSAADYIEFHAALFLLKIILTSREPAFLLVCQLALVFVHIDGGDIETHMIFALDLSVVFQNETFLSLPEADVFAFVKPCPLTPQYVVRLIPQHPLELGHVN